VGVNPEKIKQTLYGVGVVSVYEANETLRLSGAKVFVDGNIVGYCNSPAELTREFRERRRRGEISTEANIAYFLKTQGERNEIYVNCGGGRVRRPLIIVEDGVPKLQPEHIKKVDSGEWSWEDLVRHGIIEYLDAEEEENTYIAVNCEEVEP
jgi:DNA-directed RNA polymerase subunit B